MKRVYLLPNIITAFGLACGLFVIFKITLTASGSVTFDVLKGSAMLLLLAAIADVFDGAIARILKAESEFGIQFDSLADGVTFGIAPSVIILKSFSMGVDTQWAYMVTVAAMIFSLCGVLRLVRFNVKTNKVKDDETLNLQHKKNFIGLPIPAGALAAVSADLFLTSGGVPWQMNINDEVRTITMTAVMVLLGYLMVSRWKFPSAKTLHFRIHSIYLIFLTAFLAFLFLYGVLYYFTLLIFISTWLYLISALLLSVIRLIAGRKSKTLQDFEPEPDNDEDMFSKK